MSTTPPSLGMARPLIVRLRNWVGDVVLGVAALRRLERQGYAPVLVGKRWAASLLAGEDWPVHVLPASTRDRVALYRRLRVQACAVDADFDRRINTVLLPMSFSSALETRLAGLRSLGYAHEGRSFLLRQALTIGAPVHELARDWRLAQVLVGQQDPVPEHAALALSPPALDRARARLAERGLTDGHILLCPFAGGTFEKLDKTWPDFAAWCAAHPGARVALLALGLTLWFGMVSEQSWLVSAGWGRVGRLSLRVFSGVAVYFAVLGLLGFRPKDFSKRGAN